MMTRLFSVCFAALLLAGCATAYQPTAMTGGFEEVPLSSNAFRVTFNGNGYTIPQRSSDFTLLRAAELSMSRGCAYFLSDRGIEQHSTWPPSHSIQFVCYRDRPQSSAIVYDARLIYTSISAKYREELGPRPPPVISGGSPPSAPPPARTAASAAATTPAASSAVEQAARDCAQNKDSALRVKACSTWIAANPNAEPKSLSLAYRYRGLGNAGLGNNRPALADYDKAIALDATNIDAYYFRGQMNSYLDRYREAEKDFRKSLELFSPVSAAQPTESNKNFVATLERRIARARKDAELEGRWVAYLQDIQNRNRYANWPGPPYDLYKKRFADR